MSDVDVSFMGTTVASLNASGRKKIDCKGGFMRDDIIVSYTKPSVIVPAPSRDVNFYDYDGTILYSYSAADFANLSALPPNPTHAGLTSQGWNWTLADAKAQVLISGILDIGQQYVTSDGKTRLYITLGDVGRLTPKLFWSQSVSKGVTIDWGDGSATQTLTGTGEKNLTHTYPATGDYVITLEVTSGTMLLGGGSSSKPVITGSVTTYRKCLRKVELGTNAGLNVYAFYNSTLLESCTLPTSTSQICSFYNAHSMKFLTVPNGITSLENSMRYMYATKGISLPKTLTTLTANCFYGINVTRLALPPVTSIPSGAFYAVNGLSKLVIPASVTSIEENAFYNCTGIAEYHFKSTNPPSLTDATAFTGIQSDCKIYVPSAKLTTYQTASVWSDFASYMEGE